MPVCITIGILTLALLDLAYNLATLGSISSTTGTSSSFSSSLTQALSSSTTLNACL